MAGKDDRRGYQDFIALVQSVKDDLRQDMKAESHDLKESIDQNEKNILQRIAESHADRRVWEEGHAGTLPTSVHGQLTTRLTRHQEEHLDMSKDATKTQIITGGVILVATTSVTAFVVWAMSKLLGNHS